MVNFNSRPSARGDLYSAVTLLSRCYFNSRPSARGDATNNDEVNWSFISIHAPPRGATLRFGNRSANAFISIHAPPRGATSVVKFAEALGVFQFTPLREGRLPATRRNSLGSVFQFTPLREGRLPSVKKCNQDAQISIHAPPRGATLFC